MSVPLVTFIVPNLNGKTVLRECLESIRCQTVESKEVIVADNGSTDGSCDLPYFDQPGWQLLRFGENLGFAAANNRALPAAAGRYVALVNNDVTLEPHWAERMTAALEANPAVGSAACRILQADNPGLVDSCGFEFFSCGTTSLWRGQPADFFTGRGHRPIGAAASAALYRRTALDVTGLFIDAYFCYYEDTDLALRLVLHGFDCVYVNDALAYHRGSYTGRERSDFHVYHLRRNIEYVYWTDMVGALAWIYLLPHVTYELLAWGGALLTGQGRVVARAKMACLRNAAWIATTRRGLRDQLMRNGKLSGAGKRLRARLSPWTRGIARSENAAKMRRGMNPASSNTSPEFVKTK